MPNTPPPSPRSVRPEDAPTVISSAVDAPGGLSNLFPEHDVFPHDLPLEDLSYWKKRFGDVKPDDPLSTQCRKLATALQAVLETSKGDEREGRVHRREAGKILACLLKAVENEEQEFPGDIAADSAQKEHLLGSLRSVWARSGGAQQYCLYEGKHVLIEAHSQVQDITECLGVLDVQVQQLERFCCQQASCFDDFAEELGRGFTGVEEAGCFRRAATALRGIPDTEPLQDLKTSLTPEQKPMPPQLLPIWVCQLDREAIRSLSGTEEFVNTWKRQQIHLPVQLYESQRFEHVKVWKDSVLLPLIGVNEKLHQEFSRIQSPQSRWVVAQYQLTLENIFGLERMKTQVGDDFRGGYMKSRDGFTEGTVSVVMSQGYLLHHASFSSNGATDILCPATVQIDPPSMSFDIDPPDGSGKS